MFGNQFDWTNPEKVWALIYQWVHDNAPKIKRIHDLGYGWEPWLQADLADFLQQHTQATTVHRESLVYGDDKRMDLTMWECSDGSLTNYFEFKCRSKKMDAGGLATGLTNDYEKAMLIQVDRKNTRAWIMGFYVEDGKPPNLGTWTSKSIDGIGVVYKNDIIP